jgi:N utilization substance protein A
MRLEHLDLSAVLEQVGREKNISKEILVSALEDAMLSSARKKLGIDADLEARYNEEIGEVEVFEFRRIIADDLPTKPGEINFSDALRLDPGLGDEAIGEDLGIKLESKEFGRIAAQNAKQIIIQRVRDAERMMVYNEYKDRKDEIVAGTVRRFERGDIIVDLGRAEAVIPTSEQINKENIRLNDRIVAYVLDVLEVSKSCQIVLSRSHPNLVVKLFEQEVPEIAEGVVSIESVAREAGLRTKISVRSKDSDVDPVGACVGMKGSRVQAVVQELKGEKIDIVPFDLDEARFVCNALAPAEVTRVLVNEDKRNMKIIVPDEQYSLAIGRKGQNVRLASQLTGWKIDIDSESTVAADKDQSWVALSQIKYLSELQFQTLFNHGIKTLNDVLKTENTTLSQMPGFDNADIDQIKAEAQSAISNKYDKEGLEKEEIIKETIVLFKLLNIIDDNPSEALDISVLGVFDKELLNNAGYLDIADIFLEKNISRLANSMGVDEEEAKALKEKAYRYLQSLNKSF